MKFKNVLILRPKEQIDELKNELLKIGLNPIAIPSIELIPNFEEIDNAINEIENYDILIFTSANAVKFTLSRVNNFDIFKNIKIAVIGPKTEKALKSFHLNAHFMPDKFISDEIVNVLNELKNKKIILFRSDLARKDLVISLKNKGAIVKEIVAYKTIILNIKDKLKEAFENGIDLVIFTSSSTVISFLNSIENKEVLKNLKFICIGPITRKTAMENGLNVDYMADEYNIEGIIKKIKEVMI
ncbi:MAG: uroporphyrinogen-III synthase [candidate division WOR-3 bacterium]|jgi:uroporphyrinogen-III synthase